MFDLSGLSNLSTKIFQALTNSDGNHLTPIVLLSINGQPFGTQTMSRILSVQLTDNRGFEADELTIELDDSDGLLSIPALDSLIKCSLGFKETAIVYKGEFKMSEFTHSGAPDRLNITARSADLDEKLAEQQEKSWHKQTLYQIVETIAKKYAYEYLIGQEYQSITIDHIDQTNESDASFLSRLAEQYDAIATIKDKKLLFLPVGAAKTASGKNIEPVIITRMSGDNHSFTYSSTDNYAAVKAFYTEKKTGKKQSVIINKDNFDKPKDGAKTGRRPKNSASAGMADDGQKIKILRHLYANKANAEQGARAAFKKLKRGLAEFKINLAIGRPDLYPETPVYVSGFKTEIDCEDWMVARVVHSVNDSGYTCALELQAKLNLEN